MTKWEDTVITKYPCNGYNYFAEQAHGESYCAFRLPCPKFDRWYSQSSQAELSFKAGEQAGMRKVVKWIKTYMPATYESSIRHRPDWIAFLHEQGEEVNYPAPRTQGVKEKENG